MLKDFLVDAFSSSISIAVRKATKAGARVIAHKGEDAQVMVAIGEMGELLTALADYRRGRIAKDEILGEIADVILCTLQVGLVYGFSTEDIAKALTKKTNRLMARMDAGEI